MRRRRSPSVRSIKDESLLKLLHKRASPQSQVLLSSDDIHFQRCSSKLKQLQSRAKQLQFKIIRKKGKKHHKLSKAHKVLQQTAKLILDHSFNPPIKSKLISNIKKLSSYLESIGFQIKAQPNLKTQNKKLKQQIRSHQSRQDRISLYKQALEKIRNQTQTLKEKLVNLDQNNLRLTIRDQDQKIQYLESQNQRLNRLNDELHRELNQQKSRIRISPQRDQSTRFTYTPEYLDEGLQNEIKNLDLEIARLQTSLQRTLEI